MRAEAHAADSAACHPGFDAIPDSGDTHGMRPAIAYIHIDHLKHNYRLLRQHAGGADVMAVVKADAYGHGLALVAPALREEGCRHFAVTDATEGERLRAMLPDAQSITLLSGLFDPQDAQLARQHALTPVVIRQEQLTWLTEAAFGGKVWIKVDTGMQRIGADDPQSLLNHCRNSGVDVAGIISHLACADTPEHPLNRLQAEEFERLHQMLGGNLPASLLNSAGIVALPQAAHDFVRPGIALYGCEPVASEPLGLKPVMQLTGSVIQVRNIEKGVSLSYGASYTAPHAMQVATVSLGYGDGLPRRLSNLGHAICADVRHPIVGRICMDYCLLDCTAHPLTPGDTVRFWGDNLPADAVARQLDTIAYELFTGINRRVCRRAA